MVVIQEQVDGDDRPPSLRTTTMPTPMDLSDGSASTVDAAMAEELNALTISERDKVLSDIHGVAKAREETPEFLERCFARMQAHIDQISNKPAYDRALAMNPQYVLSHKFRLAFLRCEIYSPLGAAQRFARFFEMKSFLFGNGEILARDVTLRDLTANDILALEKGHLSRSQVRDRAGRLIILFKFPVHVPVSYKNILRADYFFKMSLLENEHDQRMGIVGIIYNMNLDPNGVMLEILTSKLLYTVPFTVGAVHYCMNLPAQLEGTKQAHSLVMDKNHFLRTRYHVGPSSGVETSLRPFGISFFLDPRSNIVDSIVSCHEAWLQSQRTSMMIKDNESREPGQHDVLFGRSFKAKEHPGNRQVRILVELHQPEYDVASKLEKTEIARRIIDIVHQSGGKFLKREGVSDTSWVEVDDDAAREKVCMFFRKIRRDAK